MYYTVAVYPQSYFTQRNKMTKNSNVAVLSFVVTDHSKEKLIGGACMYIVIGIKRKAHTFGAHF